MSGREELEGLVLCRVGDFQLAFFAIQVNSITAWELADAPLPLARAAYALPAAAGKRLTDDASSLVVDALEISTEPLKLMPVPAMLLGAAGGALRGFVAASGALMPLLGFSEFA